MFNYLLHKIDNTTLEKFPKPPKNPCIDDPEKMCDFQADCDAAEDEAKCGEFVYSKLRDLYDGVLGPLCYKWKEMVNLYKKI